MFSLGHEECMERVAGINLQHDLSHRVEKVRIEGVYNPERSVTAWGGGGGLFMFVKSLWSILVTLNF